MKIFIDLEFKTHPIGNGKQATIFFKNGYGVSVVRFVNLVGGYSSHTSNENEWELAVLSGDEKEWHLTYETQITDDVLGHLTEKDVTEIMRKVQKLI